MIWVLLFWLSLGLLVYSYIGYYMVLLVLVKIKVTKRKYDISYTPSISMIISAYNEEKFISDKIKNLLEIDYPRDKIEFLIGSDGSTDHTNEIIESYCKHENVKLVPFKDRLGKSCVLNKLVSRATGEILVFSDANTFLAKDAIKHLVKYFIDSMVGGVCGKLELTSAKTDHQDQVETLYWKYETRLKQLEGKIKTVFGTNGGIYAIRKSLYQYLPENTMVSDDFLIPIQVIKQGFDVIFETKAIGRETITRTIRDEFARRIRISVGYFNDLKEIRSLLVPRLTFVSFGLWSHKILRWLAPFLLIFLFVSNLLIIDSIFFNIILIIQIVFYSTSFIGFVLGRIQKVKNIALVSYCYYFASQNLALLIGFMKSLLKSQKPIWEKVERDISENNLMI